MVRDLPVREAIASVSGISLGIASIVPAALLGTGGELYCSDVRTNGTEMVNGKKCTRLVSDWRGLETTFSISQEDQSVRKVTVRGVLDMADLVKALPPGNDRVRERLLARPKLRIDRTIVFDPVFDQPVDPARLR